ncbi:MAG: hypothetical protein EOP04_00565 [Proteobacteria bacterium]|nr:MAG: hypothetical protein EOP04_00565 [Pseudomonadota bacterium]
MNKEKEIDRLAKEIAKELGKLESTFWDVFVAPSETDEAPSRYWDFEKRDHETWLFHGTRRLYYKICFFLELKANLSFLEMFKKEFESTIKDETATMESYGGLYNDSEPSMIIHDRFRDFLSVFPEFDYELLNKAETNKLRLILENTNSILARTKAKVTGEASIYNPIKWLTEIIYPNTRLLGKARFIDKFTTYHPDILVPEISSAVEYKLIRTGKNPGVYIDQIKTDADNYIGDLEYKFFYAVVFFENKSEINPKAFDLAVKKKKFPDNWEIMAL